MRHVQKPKIIVGKPRQHIIDRKIREKTDEEIRSQTQLQARIHIIHSYQSCIRIHS